MAPEQAQAQTDLTTAVDVYGLGALLYELLTGRPPFKKNTPLETMMAAVSQEPPRPRKLAAEVDPDLETICLKCLEKDPLARYASADALADDLQRWRDGEPIHARPVTTTERLVKWSRRQPLLAGSLATIAVAVLTLLILAGFLWQNAELRAQAVQDLGEAKSVLAQVNGQREVAEVKKSEAEKLADEQRQLANQQKALAEKIAAEVKRLEVSAKTAEDQLATAQAEARRTVYAADMQLAHAAWRGENIPAFRELLDRYRDPAGEDDLRGFEWHYLDRQLHAARLSWRVELEQQVNLFVTRGVAVSPDGKLLATAHWGDEVRLWDLANGALLRTVAPANKNGNDPTKGGIAGLFFADEGRQLVAVVCKPADFQKLGALAMAAMSKTTSFHAATVAEALEFQTWTLAEESPPRVERCDFRRLQGPLPILLTGTAIGATDAGGLLTVSCIDRSPDGKRLALAASEVAISFTVPPAERGVIRGGRLIVWDLEQGKIVAQQKSPAVLTAVAFSPDGQSLAVATFEGAVGIGKSDLSQSPRPMEGHHGPVGALHFIGDGSRLASGGYDGSIVLWDVATASEARRLRGHSAALTNLDVTADGQSLISASVEGEIKVWDLTRPSQPLVLHDDDRVTDLTFASDSTSLVAAEASGLVKIWNASTAKFVREVPPPADKPQGVVQLSPRGTYLLWGVWSGKEKFVGIRNLTDGTDRQLSWQDHSYLKCAISPDERLLACADLSSGHIGVFSLASGDQLKELTGENYPSYLVFSHDGKRLAASGQNAALWDWQAGTSSPIAGMEKGVGPVAFSPDGTRIAAVTGDTIRIWDLPSDRLVAECHGAGRSIGYLAFSPDGRRLATAGMPAGQVGILKLWDTASGREVFTAPLPPAMISAIAWSPDGLRLAAALNSSSPLAALSGQKAPSEVYVWDLTPPEKVAQANDAGRLAGTWVVVSAELNGEAAASSVGDKFIFAGDKVTIETKVRKTEPFAFRLDLSKQPRHIDVDGQPASLGIFELERDKLTICYGVKRPAAFDSRQGLLLKLLREPAR
jgi:uncharacterized protein (TIGR03067 family)